MKNATNTADHTDLRATRARVGAGSSCYTHIVCANGGAVPNNRNTRKQAFI